MDKLTNIDNEFWLMRNQNSKSLLLLTVNKTNIAIFVHRCYFLV